MRFLKPFCSFSDDRGLLLGIVKNKIWRELNFLTTKAGAVRGNHFHKKTEEMVCFIEGKVKLKTYNTKNNRGNTIELKPGDIVLIEPYEVHTFEALSDSKWINMLSIVYDAKNPDVFKRE